jgi:hypothetical protein
LSPIRFSITTIYPKSHSAKIPRNLLRKPLFHINRFEKGSRHRDAISKIKIHTDLMPNQSPNAIHVPLSQKRKHLLLTFCCLAFLGWLLSSDIAFYGLQVFREEEPIAEMLARKLMLSSRGVSLALDDVDCFGGRTAGWSNWILESSTRTNQCENALHVILKDDHETLSRRVEACWILWDRTGDPSRLRDLFLLVQKRGPPAVGAGRKLLASAVDSDGFPESINDLRDEDDLTTPLADFERSLRIRKIAISKLAK